jgi:hypothetical protein
MESVINVPAPWRVHTTNELLSQINSFGVFLLRYVPVIALRRQAIQNPLGKIPCVHIELKQYNFILYLHILGVAQYLDQVPQGVRTLLRPLVDVDHYLLALKGLQVPGLDNHVWVSRVC